MPARMKRHALFLAAAASLVVALSLVAGELLTRPARQRIGSPPTDLAGAEAVTLKDANGQGIAARPHAMVGLNVIVAPTDEEARFLFTSAQQRFLGMVRGRRGKLPEPVPSMDALWTPAERLQVERMLSESVVGSPETVRAGLLATAERTGADEFIVATAVHDHGLRRRSYELLAAAW